MPEILFISHNAKDDAAVTTIHDAVEAGKAERESYCCAKLVMYITISAKKRWPWIITNSR